MRRHPDRAHPGASPAVRNREGLVQVEVADVGPDQRRTGETDLGVHVRPVHVNLSALLVNDLADGADVILEDAVRRGIGDHQAGEPIPVVGRLRSKVAHVHAAIWG